MGNDAPTEAKAALQAACRKSVQKVSGISPGDKRKLAEALGEHLCKEVDQNLLKILAYELARVGKANSAKGPKAPKGTYIPKAKKRDAYQAQNVPKLKVVGKNLPSLTIPIHRLVPEMAKYGKLDLKVWGDPREDDKGAFLNFTIDF